MEQIHARLCGRYGICSSYERAQWLDLTTEELTDAFYLSEGFCTPEQLSLHREISTWWAVIKNTILEQCQEHWLDRLMEEANLDRSLWKQLRLSLLDWCAGLDLRTDDGTVYQQARMIMLERLGLGDHAS